MRLGDVVNPTASDHGKPLEGVRILAAEQMQALPFATQLLARLGADVVKVEHPTAGESGRGAYPFMTDPEGRRVGATFLRNNLSKRSVGLDLKHAEGRELFLRLAPRFDVVCENFKAGTMDRLGLGYDDVRAVLCHELVHWKRRDTWQPESATSSPPQSADELGSSPGIDAAGVPPLSFLLPPCNFHCWAQPVRLSAACEQRRHRSPFHRHLSQANRRAGNRGAGDVDLEPAGGRIDQADRGAGDVRPGAGVVKRLAAARDERDQRQHRRSTGERGRRGTSEACAHGSLEYRVLQTTR